MTTKMSLSLAAATVALCITTMSIADEESTDGDKVKPVEVINLPDVQGVAVVNAPAVQDVAVVSLPPGPACPAAPARFQIVGAN
jgi:hypothetical protein